MCVLSYKYEESIHFEFCLVKRVQRITVFKVYECHLLDKTDKNGVFFPSLTLLLLVLSSFAVPSTDPDRAKTFSA